MAPRHAFPVLCCVLLVGATLPLAAPAAASPRPVAVCAPCDRGFVTAANAHDVDVRIERSTATMRVHRNGSATWTVENRLNAAAAATLRENDSRRRSIAGAAVAVNDGRLLSTSVDGDTVRIRYRTDDAATRTPGGVLRVDAFRDEAGHRVYTGLGAGRLTLVAPAGTTVGRALPGADVSGRRMTVTTFDSRGDGPFVTLVPDDVLLGPLWSLVAVTLSLGPIVGRNLLLLVAVPTLAFAGGLRTLAWAASVADLGPRLADGVPNRRALAVVAVGVVALFHPLYAEFVFLGGATTPVFTGAVGLIALGGVLSRPAVRDRLSLWTLAGIVGLAFAAAVAAGLFLRVVTLGDLAVAPDESVLRLALMALPVYAATLVGYGAATDGLRRGLAAAAGAFALLVVASYPLASQGGTFYLLGVVLALLGAFTGLVVGLPLFVLGYGLPASGGRR